VALAAFIDQIVLRRNEVKELSAFSEILLSASPERRNVLELGSGCGVVGISLAEAVSGCNVLLTDLPEAAEICERNINGANLAPSSSAQFAVLHWGEPLPASVQSKVFDAVFIADCTYNPDSSPALVSTLSALIKCSPKMVIVVAMKVRHQSEAVFFEYMSQAKFKRSENLNLPIPTEESSEDEQVELHLFHGPEG